MKKNLFILSLCFMTLAAVPLAGQAPEPGRGLEGSWEGTLNVGGASLRVVFHLAEDGGTMDSPDQGAMGIPLTAVSISGDTLRMSVSSIGFSYTGVLKGELIEGEFTQMGRNFPLDLTRSEAAPLNRPQEPRGPFPYRSEEVVFENPAAGITLAGTLTMPSDGADFPAVVLLTGSGDLNRDEEVFGHKPFLVLADHLTRRGIAVLRFDDRGVGGSGGDPRTATTADFATDAAAALDYLKTRKEIDHKKMGLAGHSEGGGIAFIAAAGHPDKVAFVVSMAGPGVRGEELLIMQWEDINVATVGMPSEGIPAMVAKQRRGYSLIFDNTPQFVEANIDSLVSLAEPDFASLPDDIKKQIRRGMLTLNTPWMRYFAKYDPAADLGKIDCPVLAINGDKDLQVRSSVNLAAIRAGLEAGGNTAVTVIEYPGLNHLFQTSATGTIDEYGKIEETISPRVLNDIADWILKAVE